MQFLCQALLRKQNYGIVESGSLDITRPFEISLNIVEAKKILGIMATFSSAMHNPPSPPFALTLGRRKKNTQNADRKNDKNTKRYEKNTKKKNPKKTRRKMV
jgi:hypothetical protein